MAGSNDEENRLTLRNHRELLLNYFRARKAFSRGVIEGLNNKAKVTMRKSYDFRTLRVTELALYHALGKLPESKRCSQLLLTNLNFRYLPMQGRSTFCTPASS
jgi:Transposase